MEFHEKLQELRKQRGMTQEELATALYVSRTAVSKWESGRGYPSIDSLKAISGFFGVSLDQLLSSEAVLTLVEEES
ncbi:helix-turn-helix domain-containing protein, partial [Ruminococcus champanellensis]